MSASINICNLLTFASMIALATGITMQDVIKNDTAEYETFIDPSFFTNIRKMHKENLTQLGIHVMETPYSKKYKGDVAKLPKSAPSDNKAKRINGRIIQRSAIADHQRWWKSGEIPYAVSSRYGDYSLKIIAEAMEEYRKQTDNCIRFIPRDKSRHEDYIYIWPDDGCYSLIGRTGGRQDLSLDAGCIERGTIMHELLHVLGFFHEQNRSDRDQYVKIIWTNIYDEASDQFDKFDRRDLVFFDEGYDYESIMHYGPYAFSKNGFKTIVARKAGGHRMGQRENFSPIDLNRIRKLYNCPNQPPPKATDCADKNHRCYHWATNRKYDYCRKYKKLREEICPKSCGHCTSQGTRSSNLQPTTESLCKDINNDCPLWKRLGYCNKGGYKNYMSRHCAQSCQFCGHGQKTRQSREASLELQTNTGVREVSRETTTRSPSCEDAKGFSFKCTRFATMFGGCEGGRFAEVTRRYCRKTCALC